MISYDKYLTKDYELDYQKLYKDMSNIVGFNQKNNREELYNNVVSWYNEKLPLDNEEDIYPYHED